MFDPKPKFQPDVRPKRQPKVTVPSYARKFGQVANWLFYNGAGDVLYDFSGRGNHGEINKAVWRDGSYGWALEFDETVDDYANISDDPSLDITGEVTVEAWIYRTADTGSWEAILAKGNDDVPTETMAC